MINCSVITIFPEMLSAIKNYGITGRAVEKKLLTLDTFDVRDFAFDKHSTVDDRPYGGGPGMVMMVEPLRRAIQAAKSAAPSNAKVIYVTPAGKRFDHQAARRLADEQRPLIFVAGRYEGIDHRVIERDIDEQFSIGDYVLSGGELAAMVMIDAVVRWIPGALGHEASAPNDAFSEENAGLLDCPHYTRPADLGGEVVPPVLLSGDHQAIALWRKKQSLGHTWLNRPDLLQQVDLDKKSQRLLAEFKQEHENLLEESS